MSFKDWMESARFMGNNKRIANMQKHVWQAIGFGLAKMNPNLTPQQLVSLYEIKVATRNRIILQLKHPDYFESDEFVSGKQSYFNEDVNTE